MGKTLNYDLFYSDCLTLRKNETFSSTSTILDLIILSSETHLYKFIENVIKFEGKKIVNYL